MCPSDIFGQFGFSFMVWAVTSRSYSTLSSNGDAESTPTPNSISLGLLINTESATSLWNAGFTRASFSQSSELSVHKFRGHPVEVGGCSLKCNFFKEH